MGESPKKASSHSFLKRNGIEGLSNIVLRKDSNGIHVLLAKYAKKVNTMKT